MKFKPKHTKHAKMHKGRMEYAHIAQTFNYGNYAIISKETGNLSNKQLATTELVIKRTIRKEGTITSRVFPHHAVTRKPSEVRMGKGKGSVDHYIARIRPGAFIFEIKSKNGFMSKHALETAASKLPFKTMIIQKEPIAS